MHRFVLGLFTCSLLFACSICGSVAKGTVRARYLVLTAENRTPPPFRSVDVLVGPKQTEGQWWQVEVRSGVDQNEVPGMRWRVLSGLSPFDADDETVDFLRYQLNIPATGETLEYLDVHTGRALLPGWANFQKDFVPRKAGSSALSNGVPETLEYLGHVLTLTWTGPEEWTDWPDVKTLSLDPEFLVGTGRNFKDAEGHRLPQKPERRDYTYVEFTEDDYRTMIGAGITQFTIKPHQEAFVRDEPVFYIRHPAAKPTIDYPADLYRANHLGQVMFLDEPSILMVGDPSIHNTLRYFSDAAALIRRRTHNTYDSDGNYGSWAFDKALRGLGINLGDMRIQQWDIPAWETYYDMAHYQVASGPNGIVHEGRYQLAEFDREVNAATGFDRKYTAEELLRYHYAFLRGASRRFGKNWGTAIYGQADPTFSDVALTLAYDMGARWFWFWTSDHDHHVPWPEQLELARKLRDHRTTHPRPSIRESPSELDTLILVPNGYFLSLENLWWVRVMDKDRTNEASQRYRQLMQNAFREVHTCFDRGEDFDIGVDDGTPISGYRRVVRIHAD